MKTGAGSPKPSGFLQHLFGPAPTTGAKLVQRYSRQARWLHWVNAGAWTALFITGLFLFVPEFGPAAMAGWSRLFHRIGAGIMVGWTLQYFLVDPKGSLRGLKSALAWGRRDLGWLVAAPSYYFAGKEEKMPPQHHMNTGQKIWWLYVIAAGVLMIITGFLMWIRDVLPSSAFLWTVFVHDVGFIVLLCFALIHIYLSVVHPLMRGVFWSMWRGSISAKYAKSHHAQWYEEISGEETEAEEPHQD